jgi:DNA-binding GntR family transcriptional regulator
MVTAQVQPERTESAEQRSQVATDRIRELIAQQLLLPGEKILQVDLSEKIGVSRSPLREALRTLESEGMVEYVPNRGYVVTRLDSSDLRQIYRMRELLEAELLSNIRVPTKAEFSSLTALNRELGKAAAEGAIHKMLELNRGFHFGIFSLSDRARIRREVERLWQLSEGYRATYLGLPETRSRIVDEHRGILAALKDPDIPLLQSLSASHRQASQDLVIALLGSR